MLTALQTLDLSGKHWNPETTSWQHSLPAARYSLSGIVPTALQKLDLSHNRFSGNILYPKNLLVSLRYTP